MRQGEGMTYDRMEATPIAGEHCRFCGDTAFMSFRGGGRCQYAHERFTLCYSHYIDGHSGPWQTCQKCREFWTPQEYKAYAEHPLNVPRYGMVGEQRGPNPV